MGNKVTVLFPPQRIVSLVPSQTELLADLCLDLEVKGITRFCAYPKPWKKTKTIIGGTKKFDFQKIDSVRPDLIIGNKEENYHEGIAALQGKYPVWMSDVVMFNDAINMIRDVGQITGREDNSLGLINMIMDSTASLKKLPRIRVLYLIWKKPWMGAASGTFIHEMLSMAGFENCLGNQMRYPELSNENIVTSKAEVVLLSSEPYPFRKLHIEEISRIVPGAQVLLVDGKIFSWYGSRLKSLADSVSKLRSLIG